jgi:hypothetical protein
VSGAERQGLLHTCQGRMDVGGGREPAGKLKRQTARTPPLHGAPCAAVKAEFMRAPPPLPAGLAQSASSAGDGSGLGSAGRIPLTLVGHGSAVSCRQHSCCWLGVFGTCLVGGVASHFLRALSAQSLGHSDGLGVLWGFRGGHGAGWEGPGQGFKGAPTGRNASHLSC